MCEQTVNKLPTETVRLITSTQIIKSVYTAVKELLENSIDAGGTTIQIRLENYGLDLIEVKDNGWGVSYDNVQKMFLPGYTSKIKHFEDLDRLHSYGFRGEALASICKIAKVNITTKTNSDALAMTYDIDSAGIPVSSKPSHLNTGTSISIINLFSNLPVRRLYLSTKKKLSEELKKTEQIVQSLSIIHPELNVFLFHNKCMIWKKNSVKGLKQSFMQAVTLKVVSKMDHISQVSNEIHLDLIIPKKNLTFIDEVFTNSPNSQYVYVNKRPINCKMLSQPVQEHIFHHFSELNINFKFAVCLISVNISPHLMDINIEPNKTKVLFKNHVDIIKLIDKVLKNYYEQENFCCNSLKEACSKDENLDKPEDEKTEDLSNMQESEDDIIETSHPKKPKLSEKTAKLTGKSIRGFIERNLNWNVDIINENEVSEISSEMKNEETYSSQPLKESLSLCSQINKENCVLTTEDEINELNAVINEKHHSVIATNHKNSVTRLVERDELQCKPVERKILPDWPQRSINKVSAETDNTVSINEIKICNSDNLSVLPNPFEEKNHSAEKLVTNMESDAKEEHANVNEMINNDIDSEKEIHLNDSDLKKFNLSMQSVSSQMGKKEMKAFTKFSRIMRPKILEEFPKLMFTQVAALLAERWKALTPVEVKYYEKLANVVELKRKNFEQEKKIESYAEKPKKSIKSISLELVKRKNKLTRPPRKEITQVTSLNSIKKLVENKLTHNPEESSENIHQVVGPLQPSGNWLYVRNKEIGHIRHECLREVVTFQKLLSSHSLERKFLNEPIVVNELNLGSVYWTVLISLDVEFCSKSSRFIVTCDVIDKNGFRIEMERKDEGYTCGYITEIASSIPQFGIFDLKDALNLYLENGEIGGLASWRPTSVRMYLTNEAIRRHSTPTEIDKTEIEELMNTYNLCLKHMPPICLHRKSLFSPIHYIQV